MEKMGWPPRRLGRKAVEQGQCFHHCRSFFHSLRAGGGPLSFALSPSLLPLSFYAFLPAKDPLSLSGCRWVPSAGRYQCLYAGQGWGMDEFCKSPFSSLFPGSFAGCFPSPSPSEPGFRPALHRGQPRCRQAFKRQGRFLFLPRRFLAAIMCALLLRLRMTRAQGRGMSTGSLVESRRATDKVVSVERRRRRRRRRVAFDSNSLSQYLPPFPPPVHPCCTVSLCSQSRFRRRYYFLL